MGMETTFRCTPWYHWVWVIGGVGNLTVAVFYREVIPYGYLGPVGDILHHMNYSNPLYLTLLLTVTVAAHIMEAIYAFILARRMKLDIKDTALWTCQTLVLGFTSLLPLHARYKKRQTSKKD